MSLSLSSHTKKDVGRIGLQLADLPPMGRCPEQTRLDIRTLWPEDRRDLPTELEIGSGKGTFLVQQAGRLPRVNYLGVEYATAFWRHAADRCRRHGLEQVRLLRADAQVFVEWYVQDATFQQVHIYFPDPWPKKRHHKRRLINTAFLAQLHRVLVPEGIVRIVTDHDDYFAWITEHVDRATDLFDRQPFERPHSAGEDEVVGTNFERKYRREGRPFHALALRKRS
jgi:tRNA (guanine-N7-)-methyltransferase